MGWQQFLSDASIPLDRRLHGAQVAFLTCSTQLSTQFKEDVVVQWLTQLVREKQENMWRENAAVEQEKVWRLLSIIFCSKRLQALARHHWTCPITSLFPKSIIDVLGSAQLNTHTREYIVSTVYGILHAPTVAAIITNSSSLTLHLTIALLDIVITVNWTTIEQKAVQTNVSNMNDDKQFLVEKKLKVDTDDCSDLVPHNNKDLLPEVRVLHCLALLLDVLKQQMMARNDEAIIICAQNLLRRLATARVELSPYTRPIKTRVSKQLDVLLHSCLFNLKVFPKYELFLDAIQMEDSKVVNEQSAVHIILSTCNDVIAHDSIPVLRYIVSQFYLGFMHKCREEKHRLMMLITLFYLVDVTVPGDFNIDPNSLAISFVDKVNVKPERREATVSAILKVVKTTNQLQRAPCFQAYFKTFLFHYLEDHPKTEYGFNNIQSIIAMYPLQFADELPSFLSHLITWKKKSNEIYTAYENLLIEVFKKFCSLNRRSLFLSVFLQSVVASQPRLCSDDELLLVTDIHESPTAWQLLPPRFLVELTREVRLVEPLQLCSLLEDMVKEWKQLVMPLMRPEQDAAAPSLPPTTCRCVCACALLLVAILRGVGAHRLIHVVAATQRVADVMMGVLRGLLRPALEATVNVDHNNVMLYGVLLLCREWSSLLYQLQLPNRSFHRVWEGVESSRKESLVPHTDPLVWQRLIHRIHKLGDKNVKNEMVLLYCERLNQLTAEARRQELKEAPERGSKQDEGKSPSNQMVSSLGKELSQLVLQWSADINSLVTNQLSSLLHVLNVPDHQVLARAAISVCTAGKVHRRVLSTGHLVQLYPQLVAQTVEQLATTCLTFTAGTKVTYCPPAINCKRKRNQSDNVHYRKLKKKIPPIMDYSVEILLSEICSDLKRYKACHSQLQNYANKLIKYCTILKVFIKQLNSSSDEENTVICISSLGQISKLLNVLQDFPLLRLPIEQRSLLLVAILLIFLHLDVTSVQSLDEDKPVCQLLSVIIECLSSSLHPKLLLVLDLPLMLSQLISVQTSLPFDEFAQSSLVTVETVSRAPLLRQLNKLIHHLVRILVTQLQPNQLGEVSTHLVMTAKAAYKLDGDEREVAFLRPAWILVLVCTKCIQDDLSEVRRAQAQQCVSRVGSWCLRVLHRQGRAVLSHATAYYALAVYTALVKVETQRDSKKWILTGVNAETEAVFINGTSTVNGWEAQDSGHPSALEETLNAKLDGGEGGKAKRWQRYLDDGVQIAKMSLESGDRELESIGMCFIIATKQLPAVIQQKLPSDLFRFALNYFTKPPVDTAKYITAHSSPDDEQLLELNSDIYDDVMTDPINNKPISLSSFLADCPIEIYSNLLQNLLSRTVSLSDGLFPHTAAIWSIIINTEVPYGHGRAKRSALNALSRSLVWLLTEAPGKQHTAADTGPVGHKASVMHLLLSLLCRVMKSYGAPTHTVLIVISAVNAPTKHLSLQHFVKVWQSQVSLLDGSITANLSVWERHVAGLLGCVQHLMEQLVLRSRQDCAEAVDSKEALTGCGLCFERLIRKLPAMKHKLQYMIHLTLGAFISALHCTTVIAPVKKVLDQQINHVFKLCSSHALDHLLVALPAETVPLVQHYHHTYFQYCAYDMKTESGGGSLR